MQFIGLRILMKRIKAIRFMMADKSVPKRKKALIVFGIVYLFLPVDLIPIVVFPIAWMDDLLLWIVIIWYLRKELDRYWQGDAEVDLSKKYRRKTVIDDVEYEIKEKKPKDKDDTEEKDED